MTKPLPILALLALSTLAACVAGPARVSSTGEPAFRVRSDFTAGLNADAGWAGAVNENVTVNADQPFRLRFEAERSGPSTGSGAFRLQYRRNGGEWTAVEAHDFPYPSRELEMDFADAAAGTTPEGWSVGQGQAAGVTVIADGSGKILRAQARDQALIGLYPPPWELEEFAFATELRLPAENHAGVALVFGYVDERNHHRVFLDGAAGTIRVIRVSNGRETVVAEEKAVIPRGEWLEMEISLEAGELEVNFQDDKLEFTTALGARLAPSSLGFHVPANQTVEFREFVIEGEPRSPRVSIVACPAYENGAATRDLLSGSAVSFRPGVGMSLAERTPTWTGTDIHGEFEWALVVRRFADGAATNEEGDTFELRMVDANGAVVSDRSPELRLVIPPGHVGGTFVETPGRIGPWQARNGDLYFIMEPAESSNLFMMIKSTDQGRSWHEVDGANRPETDDLEAVDGRQVGDTIHIIHQVTQSSRYHAFRTSDHPTQPDTWAVRDELAASATSVAQAATLVVRSDGSMVTFHVGQTIHYSIRSPSGEWSPETIMDEGLEPKLAGPHAVLGADDTVHVAYYGIDGTVWYRRLLRDGTLTERQQLAQDLATTRAEFGSVLPLVFIPEQNTVVILYRLADGRLWERRIVNDGAPRPAVRVTDRKVVQNAVDSQQAGADAVWDGAAVQVLFIEDESRGIFSTNDRGGWQRSTPVVENIRAYWVRGNVYIGPDGQRVYGFIYDAGSSGGAGMNRFGEVVLRER